MGFQKYLRQYINRKSANISQIWARIQILTSKIWNVSTELDLDLFLLIGHLVLIFLGILVVFMGLWLGRPSTCRMCLIGGPLV